MEIRMSMKPDFANMTTIDLRAYVLQHREDAEALHMLIDKLHADSSSARVYSPEDNISEALAEHLQSTQP
jgi:hypothetical protein